MSWNITEIFLCWDFIMEQGSCHYDFKLLVKYMYKEKAGQGERKVSFTACHSGKL